MMNSFKRFLPLEPNGAPEKEGWYYIESKRKDIDIVHVFGASRWGTCGAYLPSEIVRHAPLHDPWETVKLKADLEYERTLRRPRENGSPIDTDDYRHAIGGVGPRAFEWEDKPHRLVYDLCMEVERLRGVVASVAPLLGPSFSVPERLTALLKKGDLDHKLFEAPLRHRYASRCGAAVRDWWQKKHGTAPVAKLTKKTSGSGSHYKAHYPLSEQEAVDQLLLEVAKRYKHLLPSPLGEVKGVAHSPVSFFYDTDFKTVAEAVRDGDLVPVGHTLSFPAEWVKSEKVDMAPLAQLVPTLAAAILGKPLTESLLLMSKAHPAGEPVILGTAPPPAGYARCPQCELIGDPKEDCQLCKCPSVLRLRLIELGYPLLGKGGGDCYYTLKTDASREVAWEDCYGGASCEFPCWTDVSTDGYWAWYCAPKNECLVCQGKALAEPAPSSPEESP